MTMQISNPFISIFFNLSVKFYYLPFLKKFPWYLCISLNKKLCLYSHPPTNQFSTLIPQ